MSFTIFCQMISKFFEHVLMIIREYNRSLYYQIELLKLQTSIRREEEEKNRLLEENRIKEEQKENTSINRKKFND